ncbi:hypothetical protein Lgra_0462 [Legionella gratiana]|uniref:Uncharacterized protein n=1 Tax=Legionella gratiana TaxID=45066 RepID=A0A378JA63_9GAMM|nr:hypothetical protein [Legionella gratiana]KTD14759.1 hypothetical protein Lgra_0462 [Legionella gratiana]STX44246.1 Uncharacterised protein [Legionella gratiana]
MSDFKSKLPDLKELASMTSKLYTDIKKSVGEIVQSYKENRAQQESEQAQAAPETPPAKEEVKAESKPVQEAQPVQEEVKTESKPTQEAQPIKEEVETENSPVQEEIPDSHEQTSDAPTTDDSKK